MDEIYYSQHLKDTLEFAKEVAREFNTTYIGSEHLVLAMLCVDSSSACRFLIEAGVQREKYAAKFKLCCDHTASNYGFTPRTKQMLFRARDLALEASLGSNLAYSVGTEHLLSQILWDKHCYAVQILESLGVNTDALYDRILEFINADSREAVNPPKKEGEEEETPYVASFKRPEKPEKAEEPKESEKLPFDDFGVDLTQKAREGKLDPVVGRRKEIERVIEILARRTKNNPVLIGEPGVGKSAVVEGLAQAIVARKVPDVLLGKTVFSLNMSSVVAGTRYRGDFEERLKQIADAIVSNKNIILFIDEIHTIVRAGAGSDSSMDAANILKPMLARGELQTVGATTRDEYRKYIEKDAALERRFTPVVVEQPNIEDAITILGGIKDKYEAHHNVIITDEAIEAAVKLSDRYVTDRFLPDKAIDLIDEAASRARLSAFNGPPELGELTDELRRLDAELERAKKWGDDEKVAKIGQEKAELTEKRKKISEEWESRQGGKNVSIGTEDIARIVSDWTGVPLSKLTEEESAHLLSLEEELHRRIVGQDEAISSVARAIRRARVGLKDVNRPIGSFIFVGPTGVGKTDLSKALAEILFGDERTMIRLDMSEFMEANSVSKLIGSAPGYVGYENTSGVLAEQVRRHPYSLVLFDEIEKAHPDIFNVLLQILDDGRLTDNHGRTVSFKNTVIILTSNTGAQEAMETSSLGFGDMQEKVQETRKAKIEAALKRKFKPEFLNRLDEIVVFHSLTKEEAAIICGRMVDGLAKRLAERGITLVTTKEAVSLLVEEGYNAEMGARPLKRIVRRRLEDPLSEIILKDALGEKKTIIADVSDGSITFRPV